MLMRAGSVCVFVLAAGVCVAQPPGPVAGQLAHGAAPLTPAETAAGWKSLFDGTSTKAWRGFKQEGFPAQGWKVEDGCLRTVAGEGQGDLVTTDEYGDFEFTCEWKVAPGGNSGIMYRVAETLDATWHTGPEYQLLDDAAHKVGPDDMHASGAIYDLYQPSDKKHLKAVGEFNSARIRLKDGLLQHWLNGQKVAEARVDSKDWTDRIAKSKFKDYKGFGVLPRGHIALQYHGDSVWFRNIRVRDLSAPLPGEVKLFNGQDLSGWTFTLNDNGKRDDVWSVKDGRLLCRGTPAGYIRTEADYTNYVLKLEWRFNPEKAGNSGVLLRVNGPDKVWPRSIEAQLENGNAGDFWNIDEMPMKTEDGRRKGRNTRHTHAAERPLGEWNEYEIIADHGTVTLNVNGETLNRAWDCAEIPGKIALQSEGGEIEFRNIRLSPLK